MTPRLEPDETLVLEPPDAAVTRATAERLAAEINGGPLRITVAGGEVELPAAAARLVAQLLGELGAGNGVSVRPVEGELTVPQAADFLNVSVEYMARLLDAGTVPSTGDGPARRVPLRPLAAYKLSEREARLRILDELAAEAQQLGIY